MKGEYVALKSVQVSEGYKLLQALWTQQGIKIMDAMQKAAARNQESAWRYQAGQMKGFDLAISQLDRALFQMEKEDDAQSPAQQSIDELLKEVRGDKS